MDVVRPNSWVGIEQNVTTLISFWSLWPNPIARNAELVGGYSGHGIIWENAPGLWYVPAITIVFLALRSFFKRVLAPPVARYFGVTSRKASDKFGYTTWLTLYYTSTCAGALLYVFPGKSYYAFPLDGVSGNGLFINHPVPIDPPFHWYYCFGLGFYVSELVALFRETRRSDWWEYLLHHTVTIYLMSYSYMSSEHRGGAMILILHDIPDVFLHIAKCVYYIKYETVSTCFFALFAVSFVFFRLYCFPCASAVMLCLAPQVHPATVAFWMQALVISFILQSLHIFWFGLIVRMIVRLIGGTNGDPRSDDDEDEDAPKEPKRVRKGKKAE